jgi:hypothetical protein
MQTQRMPTGPGDVFKDRSNWLVSAGILEILFGCLFGLLCMLLPVFGLVAREIPDLNGLLDTRTLVPSFSVFLTMAIGLVWLGIGTIKARRWARDLMLVASWLWLIVGVISVVFLLLLMPRMLSNLMASAQEPFGDRMIVVAMVINAVFLSFFYIILPGISVLFYGGRNVRRTFEIRDPAERWTGKCPLPVLTLSQFLAGGSICLLLMPLFANALPFFGRLLTGLSSATAMILIALLLGYLTWATYKRKMLGWWATLVLTLTGLISGVMTLSKIDMVVYCQKAGFPPRQVEMLRNMGALNGNVLLAASGLAALAWLGFLLLIKKHFGQTRAA